MSETLLTAPGLLLRSTEWLDHGGVLVRGGRIVRLVRGAAALSRAARRASRRIDVEDAFLAPGLVNAHAHLELGALAGRTPRGSDFSAWIRAVLAAKAACPPRSFVSAVRSGARASLRAGVTSVADIDSTGANTRAGVGSPLRLWSMREVLDAHDASRTNVALARVKRALRPSARLREGFSPHAPFTVSAALAAAVARLADRRRSPLAVHWSETEAEVDWLLFGSGPLAALLGPSPRRSGLDLLGDAGLLRAPLALVHGNHPRRGEPARIADTGAVVVHCPGSHEWFQREPFPWRAYQRARVTIALGTDSLASNDALDLRREMRLARAGAPWLSPEQLFDMVTIAGARALGESGRVGVLAPGARADLVAFRAAPRGRRAALEALLDPLVAIEGVWVGGHRAPTRR